MNIIERNRKELVSMSVERFLALPEHVGRDTAQRNTELRAKKAAKGHLSKLGIAHDEVRVTVHPDGRWYRTDGNTRAWLWEHTDLERPKRLHVTVVYAATEADFDAAYDQVDAEGQAKNKVDQAYGAMRARGFTPISPLLQAPKVSIVLWVAMMSLQAAGESKLDHKIDLAAALDEWLPELMLLDTLKIANAKIWHAGAIAGALVALRVFPEQKAEVLAFFSAFQRNQFQIRENGRINSVDAVYALRRQPQSGTNGWDKAETHAGRTITCLKHWFDERFFRNNEKDQPKVDAVAIQAIAVKRKRRAAAPVAATGIAAH